MRFKRYITGIFICLLAVLVMSHNVGAESFAQSVLYIRSSTNPAIQAGGNCSADGTNAIKGTQNGCVASGLIVSLPYNEYLKGDIIEIDLNIVHYENDNALNAWLFKMQADSTNSANTPVALINIDYQSITQNTGIAKFYIMVGAYTNNMPTVGLSGNIFLYNHDFLSVSTTTCWRPVTDSSQAIINAINNNATDLTDVEDKIDDVVSAIQEQAEQEAEYKENEQQALEDAAEQAQESAEDAQSDSDQATSSLLSTITGFFGAIMSVNATNCKFNSGLPFLEGEGEIDLCAVPAPPIVQTISSLIMIVIFIPFAIHMYNRFISITESFQK